MKRLMIIGLWPDDTVNYCTEKCDCRRYAFDRILYHKGGRAARERICIPVVDRSGAATTYLDLPVTLLEAGVVYLRLDDGSDIFLSDTQMALIANEVERRRAECAGTGLKTLGITNMASTKFEVSMEIFKFQGEPDVSVTLTGKSPAELNTALKTLETIAKTTTLYNGDSAPEAEKSVTSEPKQAAPVVSTADKTPPKEAGKLAYARRRKGAHAPALPEMQERVCTVLARTANDQRVPEVRRENPAGRAGTVRVHLPGLQEGELRSDERRGRRNRKREVLLRLRPEHPEAHVEPGQALLYDVRRAG